MLSRFITYLFRLFLLFIIPAIALPPQQEQLPTLLTSNDLIQKHEMPLALNYDQILALIETIEEAELDDRCSSGQFEEIARLLSVLAKNGLAPSDPVGAVLLNEDIDALFYDMKDVHPLSYDHLGGYFIEPAILYGSSDLLLCKSWTSKKCHHLKRFLSKHRTAIIIGAAVVVAVTVAVIAVAAITTTAAASSAAMAASAVTSSMASETEKDKLRQDLPPQNLVAQNQIMEIPQDTNSTLFVPECSTLAQLIEEKTTPVKESLAQMALIVQDIPSDISRDRSLPEKARELCSRVSHDILDGVATLGSVVPQLLAEIESVGANLAPEHLNLTLHGGSIDPIANYDNAFCTLHEKIDDAFATDFADHYTPEAKASDPTKDYTIGLLPPPPLFGELGIDLKKFSEAGKALDKTGYTRAGRGLMKHGNRPDSVFPRPSGNPAQMNVRGQSILEEILADPLKEIIEVPGFGVKIYSSDGRGVFFRKDGTFRGFIERQHER